MSPSCGSTCWKSTVEGNQDSLLRDACGPLAPWQSVVRSRGAPRDHGSAFCLPHFGRKLARVYITV